MLIKIEEIKFSILKIGLRCPAAQCTLDIKNFHAKRLRDFIEIFLIY